MTFIVSNREIENSKKFDDIYVRGEFKEKDSNFLLFKGDLYPENNYSKEEMLIKLIEEGVDFIKKLKGYFCGAYYNHPDNKLYFFNDKWGVCDIFYYETNGGQIIISDRFMNIVKIVDLSFDEINIQALVEFLIFEYPLFEKTFIKDIIYCPLASLYEYDCINRSLKVQTYGDFKFSINQELDFEQSIDKFDKILNNAMCGIKKMSSPDTIFGLGLSGGRDSRLIAHYAKKNNMILKPFIFGEPKSDAYFISRKIAKSLELNLYELGFDQNFIKYAEESVKYNPMMSVLFCWYYSVFDKLPRHDVLLTGWRGNDQLGDFIKEKDFSIKNDKELLYSIYIKFDELGCRSLVMSLLRNDKIICKIEKGIIDFLAKSNNKEYWQKKEEFNYKFRQRIYIKNNPSLNFLGRVKSISPFVNFEIVDFLMKIPFEWRLNLRFYYAFFRKKVPNLLKIRPERQVSFSTSESITYKIKMYMRYLDILLKTHIFYKGSHKDVFKWIKNNKFFNEYVDNVLSRENEWFNMIFQRDKIINIKSNLTKDNYQLFLRILTIKLFLDDIWKK